MNAVVVQVQLLLAALSAFLPLVPDGQRDRASALIEIAAKALSFGATAAAHLDDLALKLQAVRAEVEAMAVSGRTATAEEWDAGLARVRAASAQFRAALDHRRT